MGLGLTLGITVLLLLLFLKGDKSSEIHRILGLICLVLLLLILVLLLAPGVVGLDILVLLEIFFGVRSLVIQVLDVCLC